MSKHWVLKLNSYGFLRGALCSKYSQSFCLHIPVRNIVCNYQIGIIKGNINYVIAALFAKPLRLQVLNILCQVDHLSHNNNGSFHAFTLIILQLLCLIIEMNYIRELKPNQK